MISTENRKRIWIFLSFAFGISWLTGLVIYRTGGLVNSPTFDFAGAPISLAYLLLATAYMYGPALANLFTRLSTREGKQSLLLEPHFNQGGWHYFLAAWFLPGFLTIAGAAVFFLLFPRFFDPNLTLVRESLAAQPQEVPISPWVAVILQTLQALLLAPLLNAIATFGEEFGWRGYLLPKLAPLGERKAALLVGVIWGVWHWPVILMGYNYGFNYFGEPVLGPLAMMWFTLSLSVFLSWLTYESHSIWPAVIAHGALNGIASLGLLAIQGEPSSILGPAPTGVIGGLGFTLLALILLPKMKVRGSNIGLPVEKIQQPSQDNA